MDNLTHSLFGAAVAEVYLQKKFKNRVQTPPVAVFYFFSIVANNFPDLDLLFGLIDNTSLGYLLNHRGWTHTVVGALLQSLLVAGPLWFFLKIFKKNLLEYFSDLFVLIFIGCQAHMFLDYFNSYGVHPFSPLSNQWHYMDTIFIIEPLLWISLLAIWVPPFLWKRSLFLLFPLGAYIFGWSRNIVDISNLLFAIIFTIVSFFTLSRIHLIYRGLCGLLLFFSIVFSFWGLQKQARSAIAAELSKDANYKTLDLVLSSLPTSPLCWMFLAPQVSGAEYRVLAGSLSLIGESQECSTWPSSQGLQPTSEAQGPLGDLWVRASWKASISDLSPLLKRCDVTAWMKFARVPYWQDSVLHDLRFAVRNEKNFTTLDINLWPEPHCPPVPAPWTPPRQDLIDHVLKLPLN